MITKRTKILLVLFFLSTILFIAVKSYVFSKELSDNQKSYENKIGQLETEVDKIGNQKFLISNCNQDLPASDKVAIQGWSDYKNSTYNYSFSVPSNWEITKNEEDSLELTDGVVSFSFDKTKNISKGIKDFKATSKKTVEVSCVKANELYLSYSSGFFPTASASQEDLKKRAILAVFTKNGYHFAVSLSYTFENDASSLQTNQTFDLILKTIKFE